MSTNDINDSVPTEEEYLTPDPDDNTLPVFSREYYTFNVPINEVIRLKFKAETGLELNEPSFEITVNYNENGYNLYSINDKYIIYNSSIILTDQKVTDDSFKTFRELLTS